jgi:hypothetical protein
MGSWNKRRKNMIIKKMEEGKENLCWDSRCDLSAIPASALPPQSSQAKCYRIAKKREQQCAGDQLPKPYRQRFWVIDSRGRIPWMEDQVCTYHLPLKLICSVVKLPREPHLKQKWDMWMCRWSTIAMGRQKHIQNYEWKP